MRSETYRPGHRPRAGQGVPRMSRLANRSIRSNAWGAYVWTLAASAISTFVLVATDWTGDAAATVNATQAFDVDTFSASRRSDPASDPPLTPSPGIRSDLAPVAGAAVDAMPDTSCIAAIDMLTGSTSIAITGRRSHSFTGSCPEQRSFP